MELVKCLALCEFTQSVPGYGMVVGAPESSLDEAREPMVPVSVVAALAADGLIQAPEGFGDEAVEAAADPAPAGKKGAPAPTTEEAP